MKTQDPNRYVGESALGIIEKQTEVIDRSIEALRPYADQNRVIRDVIADLAEEGHAVSNAVASARNDIQDSHAGDGTGQRASTRTKGKTEEEDEADEKARAKQNKAVDAKMKKVGFTDSLGTPHEEAGAVEKDIREKAAEEARNRARTPEDKLKNSDPMATKTLIGNPSDPKSEEARIKAELDNPKEGESKPKKAGS